MGWVGLQIPKQTFTALTSTSLPGQESGNGLVDILYGSTSPGGKLPYTIAKNVTDYAQPFQIATPRNYPRCFASSKGR